MKDFTNCIKAFLERHMAPSAFVEMVDDLGHNTDFYSLQVDKFPPSKVHQQSREMEYICRPRHSFITFHEAAREITGLKRVKITLLPGYKPRTIPPQRLLCPKLHSGKRAQRLEAELKKPKWVHAEMRMVLHLFSTDNIVRTFPYLGISKKTCFLCGHVLSHLGTFQARNNHGKLIWSMDATSCNCYACCNSW